jgi:hypothetical protein
MTVKNNSVYTGHRREISNVYGIIKYLEQLTHDNRCTDEAYTNKSVRLQYDLQIKIIL